MNAARRRWAETLATLNLPLENVQRAWLATLMLSAAYVLSMARDLSAFDSPELALAAYRLGLGHPPGQPLHVLLGYAFARVPGLDPLFGMNLLSSVAGALCVLPAWSLAETMLGRALPGWIGLVLVPFGLHPLLWESSTRIEVYSLAAFCSLWAVARVAIPDRARDVGYAGVALGLGACANPYVSLIAALSLGPGLVAALVQRRLPLRAISLAIAGGCIGLLPYLYVPWVAGRAYARGVMVWGAPNDSESLRRYFLGLDYARSRGITFDEWMSHVTDWLTWSWQRDILPLLLAGLLGVVLAQRRSLLLTAAAMLSSLLAVLLVASNTVWQPDIPDYLGYFVLAGWIAAASVATLLVRLQDVVRPVLVGALLVATAAFCVSVHPAVWQRTRHLDRVARTLAEAALREAPAGAFVVVASDHWVAPLLYLQWAEQRRPDVVVLAYGLASSSWYWQQTLAFHPQLKAANLVGPGGRAARVRRMLEANPERPVFIETLQLARELGLPACVTGWLRHVQAGNCPAPSTSVDVVVQRTAAQLGDGAAPALAVLSVVALDRGLDLWAQGEVIAADRALLAAVPSSARPQVPALQLQPTVRLPPPPTIAWRHDVALGEPARNLFVSALLRAQVHDAESAAALAVAAAQAGLPEAQRLAAP